MTNTSNIYRKARALTAKTVTAGCTPAEHVAATNLAVTIIAKHKLDPTRIAWPEPPEGWRWSGAAGQSEMVEVPAEPKLKPRRKSRTRQPAEPKVTRVTVGDRLVAMLRRPGGATIAEIMTEFGMLAHSARAIISIEARKKRGLEVTLDRKTGKYSITT